MKVYEVLRLPFLLSCKEVAFTEPNVAFPPLIMHPSMTKTWDSDLVTIHPFSLKIKPMLIKPPYRVT